MNLLINTSICNQTGDIYLTQKLDEINELMFNLLTDWQEENRGFPEMI